MTRKTLAVLFTSAAATLFGFAQPAPAQAQPAPDAKSRPNFLFIYTDDQRYDAMSCVQKEQGDKGRFPWFQTPNMDRIAAEGVRFRNAFVINSLCAPSRSNFLTGKYSHVNGVVNNHTPMPLDSVNSASLLRGAGYTTAYFGKFHHDAQKERPGFDEIYSFIGQGKYEDCPFNINGTITPTTGWVDDVTTNFAIEFLKNRKAGDKPFDMVVGFKSPHDPRTPADRAKNRFEGENPRPVPNLDVRPPFRDARPGTKPARKNAGKNEGLLNQFRCISSADDCIGQLLQTLDDLKLADNTVVIFTSDNGYYLGEHGLGDKRSAYEESMRIPMLVRYPGHLPAGATVDRLVLNIDVAPTLLDFAGVEIPKEIQGKSLRPLFEHPRDAASPPSWRASFFYEYFYENNFASPTTTAVRTETAKLIKYPDHPEWTELFDLAADPYEMKNLVHDEASKSLLEKMEAEYDAQSKAIGFKIPDYADKPKPNGADHF